MNDKLDGQLLLDGHDQGHVLELLPIAAYAVRAPHGVIAWYNSRAAEIWGRAPAIGDTDERFCGAHKLFYPDGKYMAHCDTPVALALQTGVSVHEQEVIIERPDGSRVIVSVHIDAVRGKDGSIVGVVNFFDDITEKQKTERALRESEERLRTLAESLENQVRVRTQELQRSNLEIIQQSEELRDLSKRLVQIQDDDRRHLARELHDSAGQIIAVLTMNLTKITQLVGHDAHFGKASHESLELVQQLSKEIRTMSYLLHPPLLDETGLCGALRYYVDGLTERSGITIELHAPEDFGRFSNEMELAIFRIVQECLTNIHRHSGSKTATICLSHDGDSVSVEIQDYGRGIPLEKMAGIQVRPGVGITGMRERVRHLRGNMNIDSNENGTKVSVTLPVSASAALESQKAFHQMGSAIS
jgi:signal transduction histidine kinase